VNAIDLASIRVEDDVLEAVSSTVAEIYKIVPLRFENGGRDLVIAVSDPQNLDVLTDLGFMLSRRIRPIRAGREAIMAAIERLYVPPPVAEMPQVLSEIEALDARGPHQIGRDWMRRMLKRLWLFLLRRDRALQCHAGSQPHVRFANHVIAATAESGTHEATVEYSSVGGRFHYVGADGERVEYLIPPKWMRRIIRRIAWLAKGFPEQAIPEGRINLNIHGKPFNYDVAREVSTDGERLRLRLVDQSSPEV